MRPRLFIFSLLISALPAAAQPQCFDISVTNAGQRPLKATPVTLDLHAMGCAGSRSFSITCNGQTVDGQLDDLDGDTQADELFFLTDIDGGTTRHFRLMLSPQPVPNPAGRRVYADMMLDDKKGRHPLITRLETPGDSYVFSDLYHHGAAMESELTAFRIYFDHRQNIDIYGKRLRRLELADTHFYTTPDQQAAGYGNDVLWAGNSIGCGTLRPWGGTRPGQWTQVATRGQRIIAAGPLRTIVEVRDIQTKLSDSLTADIITRHSLCAGHRELRVDIRSSQPLPAGTLCTGVQKIGTAYRQLLCADRGIAASWGSDYPEQSSEAAKTQFPPEAVGLAVYVPADSRGTEFEDELQLGFRLGAAASPAYTYYVSFCAEKEKEGFHTAEEWFASLRDWTENLDSPLSVTWLRSAE